MHEEIMVGNLVSDFVKGKKKLDYPELVQKGITLHRQIDTYTDDHPITKQAKQFFKPAVGLYAGAFVDVAYDHFLSLDETSWKETSLSSFAESVYDNLTKHHDLLPQKFQLMLPYMKSQNWLYNYHQKWGIERSFEGVARRAVYLNNSVSAYIAFEEHYSQLQGLANDFIPDVKRFAAFNFQQLLQS
jgi:acyl carrier protein phosphodiesterase